MRASSPIMSFLYRKLSISCFCLSPLPVDLQHDGRCWIFTTNSPFKRIELKSAFWALSPLPSCFWCVQVPTRGALHNKWPFAYAISEAIIIIIIITMIPYRRRIYPLTLTSINWAAVLCSLNRNCLKKGGGEGMRSLILLCCAWIRS